MLVCSLGDGECLVSRRSLMESVEEVRGTAADDWWGWGDTTKAFREGIVAEKEVEVGVVVVGGKKVELLLLLGE